MATSIVQLVLALICLGIAGHIVIRLLLGRRGSEPGDESRGR